MTRRRIARLQHVARDVRASMRRRAETAPAEPDRRTAEELERRLDATRERLRRENPPREND
ncbi:MAG TPA: hypothetical protein VFB51_04300 [Solirubrobacterales bacterium]|nr:hypothetical protein [Solirubrobacterales bacterium]